jgi:hypothetical protein
VARVGVGIDPLGGLFALAAGARTFGILMSIEPAFGSTASARQTIATIA